MDATVAGFPIWIMIFAILCFITWRVGTNIVGNRYYKRVGKPQPKYFRVFKLQFLPFNFSEWTLLLVVGIFSVVFPLLFVSIGAAIFNT